MPINISIRSFRSSKWFKPTLIAVGALVALLLALLAIPRIIDINTYRGQLVAQLEQTLGRSVKLGAMDLSVLPSVKVKVDEVEIGDDPQFASGHFVKAKSVRLQLGLWSLLRGDPQVSGIELVGPEVVLIKAQDSKWNWSTLKPLQSDKQDSSTAPFDLLVSDGRFTMIDRNVSPPAEKTYTGVNVALDDFSPRQAFDFVIGLTMPGEKAGKLEIAGEAGPIDANDSAQTPIDARLKLDQVEVASLESLFGVQSPRAGRLTADVEVKGKLAEGLAANGEIKAEQFRLVEGVEPSNTPLDANFKLTAKTEKKTPEQSEISLKLDQCAVGLGKTRANITGQITRLPDQPVFDLQLKGDQMALDSLLESAYALGFGPPSGTKASGAATINLRATGEANSIALNGQAEVRDLKFQSASLPQAIQISELKLNCNPQEITAAPFRATLSRTTVEFNNLKISDYGQQPRAHLEIATNNAQVDDLIKIAESFGARPDATGAGTATLRAAIDTNLGQATSAMTINGQGKLSNARIQPSQLKTPLEVSNADLGFTGDSLRVDNLGAKFGQSQVDGWLQIKNFDAPLANFDLKANQLNVAELQTALASGGKKSSSGSTNLRADGQISVGRLILDTLTATDAQSKVALQNQILTLDPVTLKLYGGSYQGAVRVDLSQSDTDLAINGRFSGVDVNQFLSSGGSKSLIYGRADGALNVRGRGQGGDALAKSLVGGGNVAINDGKFASFDLMKQVEVLGKLYNLPTGGAGTAFRSLKTNLKFDKGRMTTDSLQLVMDDLQVTGDGAMQLGDAPTMDYGIMARLSSALTKRVMPTKSGGEAAGGNLPIPIGGALGSVVGNFFMEKDAMVVPLKISGPLGNPSFGLNTSALQRRAKDRLLESVEERFLKKSGEQQKDQPKDQKEVKPADALKGVLDIFKKKEKKP
ncbi:MAG: AsmA family protein [Blastocatellia bacterium]